MNLGPLQFITLLLLPLLVGAGLLRALGIPPRRDPLAFLGWSWLAGSFSTAALLFLWLAMGWPIGDAALPALVLIILAVFLHSLSSNRSSQELAAPANPVHPPWERIVFGVVLIGALVLTLQRILDGNLVPMIAGDDAEFWALKAKVIYRSGGFNADFGEAMSNPNFVYHKDYPLLNPLLQVWTFAHAGEITHFANRLPIQCASIALILILASSLRRIVRPVIAAGLLLCLVSLPETIHQTRTAHADLMVALGAVTAFDAWIRYRSDRQREWLPLFFLGIAYMLWSKNEGLLYVIAILAAAGLFSIRSPRKLLASLRPRRSMGWAVLPIAVVAITFAFNAIWGFENDLIAGDTRDAGFFGLFTSQIGSHLPAVLAYFGNEILLNPAHSNLLLIGFLALAALTPFTIRRFEIRVSALVILLAFAGYIAVFTGTPHELAWHLSTAASRVSYQAIPVVLIWLGMAIATLMPSLRQPRPSAPSFKPGVQEAA